jgi:hypothetical protein
MRDLTRSGRQALVSFQNGKDGHGLTGKIEEMYTSDESVFLHCVF